MISYSHKDRPFVVKLAEALGKRGIDVWYDRHLTPRGEFSQQIEEKIRDATAVLVVWSNNAHASKYVRAEAHLAFTLDNLMHVTIEDCFPGLPFNTQHFIKLADWDFDASAPGIDEIVSAIKLPQPPQPLPGPGLRESRTDPEYVARFLDAEAKIKGAKRIAAGDLSEVYRGQYGRRQLAIKAIRNAAFRNEIMQDFSEEIAISSNLSHPAFLRISNVLFDEDICFIVSDHVDGAQTIGRKIKTDGAASFSPGEVIDILNQLCQAIVEAHVVGLRFLAVTPSQIFIKEDKTQVLVQDTRWSIASESDRKRLTKKNVRLSPINFVQFKAHLEKGAIWNDHSGPFMAPEFWLGDSWFRQCMEPVLGKNLQGEELNRAKSDKSHQFALGMVAWSMLAGRIPFAPRSDDNDPKSKERRFLRDSEKFPQQVAKARWRADARALARIVERMVHRNPAMRWPSMDQVRLLIEALDGDYAADQLDNLVKEAYQIVRDEKNLFCKAFYQRLFQKARHLQAKFPSDMSRQHRMLDFALGQLLNFNQLQSEPTTLTQFVDRHRELNLSKEDFEVFGNALVETFDAGLARENERHRMLAALEIVIWPGIFYMIQQCTAPALSSVRGQRRSHPDRDRHRRRDVRTG